MADTLSFDDLSLAVMESLDGIEDNKLMAMHRIAYPEAKIVRRGNRYRVTWPDEARQNDPVEIAKSRRG